MSKNKLIFAGSLLLTIFVLSKLMESDENDPAMQIPHIPQPHLKSQAGSDCPRLSEFMMDNPDVTPEQMYEIEECNRELAKQSGKSHANTGFLGNTTTRPAGALAHYEMDYGRNAFTVFKDRIEGGATAGDRDKTIIPFSRVTTVKENWEMPSSVVIEYTSERGTPYAYTFMLLRDDDAIKSDGARDIDRLIDLLKQRQRLQGQ